MKTGTLHALTPADAYVYEYGWSPDGKQLAVTYARGNGDDNWWVAKLATVDAQNGAMHDLLAPAYQIDDPQWSPDGKQIALIGGLMSDFGSTGGDVVLSGCRHRRGARRDAEHARVRVEPALGECDDAGFCGARPAARCN